MFFEGVCLLKVIPKMFKGLFKVMSNYYKDFKMVTLKTFKSL